LQNESFSNFNSLGTLFFNSEGETIRNLFYLDSQTFLDKDMLYLASIWYIFTVISYGVSVPSGIFLPGIIMG
jgi:H+/Cl- antiporter ClcA